MNEYDVVVIGGGAAGLSAALVLARARRHVAVVDAGRPRNAPAAHMHGFLGSDGRPPAELLAAGRREVAGYGGHLVSGTVTGITPAAGGGPRFDLALADGSSFRARRVLVTTGLCDDIPDIPGVRERWGRDLLHCPYCHGYEVRDQPLGVLGGNPEAVSHAHLIRQWSRFVPNDDLLAGLGCVRHDTGWVAVDAGGRTSVAGLWAAGNAADPRAQVITAAGEGSAAAIAINNDLVDEEVSIT
jgi:thioredoxin reductase